MTNIAYWTWFNANKGCFASREFGEAAPGHVSDACPLYTYDGQDSDPDFWTWVDYVGIAGSPKRCYGEKCPKKCETIDQVQPLYLKIDEPSISEIEAAWVACKPSEKQAPSQDCIERLRELMREKSTWLGHDENQLRHDINQFLRKYDL